MAKGGRHYSPFLGACTWGRGQNSDLFWVQHILGLYYLGTLKGAIFSTAVHILASMPLPESVPGDNAAAVQLLMAARADADSCTDFRHRVD